MPTTTEESSQKLGSKAQWIRGLYILLFFVISYIMIFVTFFTVVFQFILNLISKKSNEHLLNFGQTLSVYAFEIVNFITYNTEQMPFPFKAWPNRTAIMETISKTKSAHK